MVNDVFNNDVHFYENEKKYLKIELMIFFWFDFQTIVIKPKNFKKSSMKYFKYIPESTYLLILLDLTGWSNKSNDSQLGIKSKNTHWKWNEVITVWLGNVKSIKNY